MLVLVGGGGDCLLLRRSIQMQIMGISLTEMHWFRGREAISTSRNIAMVLSVA